MIPSMNIHFSNQPHQFTDTGIGYEIRSAPLEDGIHYAVFADGKRLTHDSIVSAETNSDIALLSGKTALHMACEEIEGSIRDGSFAAMLMR